MKMTNNNKQILVSQINKKVNNKIRKFMMLKKMKLFYIIKKIKTNKSYHIEIFK